MVLRPFLGVIGRVHFQMSPSILPSFLCNPNEPKPQEKPGTAPSVMTAVSDRQVCVRETLVI